MEQRYVKDFWDAKILNWENCRYKTPKKISNKDLIDRMNFVVTSLCENPGLRVLEIGCGSGILYHRIKDSVKSYVGVDISSEAIQEFQKVSTESKVKLHCSSVSDFNIEHSDYDMIISLGVLDWLDDVSLKKIGQLGKGKMLIHSYGQKKSFLAFFHRFYVFIAYGWKEIIYIPRYYSKEEVCKKLDISVFCVKHKKSSELVSFITSL
jgi:2-polyprenyl-3-methyl-5-hydroxy-6-metoxy-1,4-benzoquinol methylase